MKNRDPKIADPVRHECTLKSDFYLYGPSIEDCWEASDGTLWVDNGEYGSQVNYCPLCGYEAKIKIEK